MNISIENLRAAYERTKLPQNGWSFEQALACQMINKCLHRVAQNEINKKAIPPAKKYWWENV